MTVATALLPAIAKADPVSICNAPIEMSDGVTLRANVFLPQPDARVPVVLTVTGYNKDTNNPFGLNCSSDSALASGNQKLLDKGIGIMIVDDRGTGASEGRWDSWGQRTQDDYGEVLDWIQAQKWSNGKVGMNGTSYMGITSFLATEQDAERVREGKPRAVQAVWANVPMADAYRDVTFHGGAIDAGFIPLWLGLTSGLSDIPPSNYFDDPAAATQTYAGHIANGFDFAAQRMIDATTGGDGAYDGPFYRLRSPIEHIKDVRVPTAITGGWWDIFQRGEPLLYESLVNAPVKKIWMMPQYHGGPDTASWNKQNIGDELDVEAAWFDHWLNGANNGVEKLPPVNLYTMGAEKWQHLSRWPLPNTDYTPYYLGDGKSLGTAKPATPGRDETPLLPASSPCSRMTAQWTAGLTSGPCDTDNSSWEATGLAYTTPPLQKDTELTGLVKATVYAELTSAKDATLVAVLSDVDPSTGTSNQITSGFLLASQRALDKKKSWYSPDGQLIRPWHPFTRASQELVTPNDPTEYQIEIYPTSQVFKKGHQIRLTIGTADTPATETPLPDLVNETGTITLLHGPAYPSNVLLPVIGPEKATAARSAKAKAKKRAARRGSRRARSRGSSAR
ncbi:MAG TPA: CocE/NonD family hydrolase [Thermoleophilaceae bacterium]|nr:CocE/NonD family hydrolase [Thermoleophilaceae bacterium]